MTSPTPDINEVAENKQNEKEFNFRQLEAKYQRQLEQERFARLEAEKKAQEMMAARQQSVETVEEDDNEPYVDHKRLNRTLSSFEKRMEDKIEKRAKEISKQENAEEKKNTWLKNNPDFYQVLQHAEKFAEKDPELAETILEMPEGFERQKLVYKNIKALGIHLPEAKQNTIQDKINSNKQNLYYQPTGIANSPYQNAGDYSNAGKKQAYDKMKELQSRLRLG